MESATPFFSVVIPTYNRPLKLLGAFNSLANQTFKDFEVIVVDDGSTEDYKATIGDDSRNLRIRYYKKNNDGPAAARNYGIERASGRFICFLDDDDEYLENHLSVLYESIRRNNYEDGLYVTLGIVNTPEGTNKQPLFKEEVTLTPMEKLYSQVILTNCIAVSSGILKQYKFNTSVLVSEDYDLWTRIVLHYPFYRINEYTTIYNLHAASTSLGEPESVHKRHIDAFKITFSHPGVKEALPLRYRAGIFYKRYLWLAQAQKNKGKYGAFIFSKLCSIYYKLLLITATK